MKSKAIVAWLGIAAILVIATAMASLAMAQAQRDGVVSTAKVWGYYRIVETERTGNGKISLQAVVRLINRSDETFPVNAIRMLGPSGGFYNGNTVDGGVKSLATGVTTVKLRFIVSVEDADGLRGASRLALVLSVGDSGQAMRTITAGLRQDVELREEN